MVGLTLETKWFWKNKLNARHRGTTWLLSEVCLESLIWKLINTSMIGYFEVSPFTLYFVCTWCNELLFLSSRKNDNVLFWYCVFTQTKCKWLPCCSKIHKSNLFKSFNHFTKSLFTLYSISIYLPLNTCFFQYICHHISAGCKFRDCMQ